MTSDGQLLSEYAENGSEPAFRELVDRHIDVVYSAALRVVNGDTHLAQDVAQTVFSDLAKKAGSLPQTLILPGWLYRHASFAASKAVRTERRRQAREQTAMAMNATDDAPETDWEKLVPHLDEALNQLNAADRDAIVLRYFRQQDFRSVGEALGLSEDTAQKRVTRAVDKLRGILDHRGVTLSAAALASLLTVEAVSAAPAGLAASVATAALSSAAAAAGAGIPLLKGLVMTKMQAGLLGTVLLAGVGTPLVLHHQAITRMRQENQALKLQAEELAALRQENQQLQKSRIDPAELAQLRNEHAELIRLRSETAMLRGVKTELAQRQARLDSSRTNANTENAFNEFVRSPALVGMIKNGIGTAIQSQYGPFFEQLKLPQDRAEALKALLAKRSVANFDIGQSMINATNSADRQAAIDQAKSTQEAISQQIKDFLGEDQYAQFRAYEDSLTERTTVSNFKTQLADSATTLSPDQEQRLMQAMNEERKNFKFTIDLSKRSNLTGDPFSYFTTQNLGVYQHELESLDQNYLARARSILTPDQCSIYEKFLADQTRVQTAMMQMTAKIYGSRAKGN